MNFRKGMSCCLVLCMTSCSRPAFASQGITAIWVNDGEDKVTRDELRATHGGNVKNSVWDGARISIFGARNEVVAFNVILEAGSNATSNVTVSFDSLNGPSGATITSSPASGNGVFNWVGRNIELFYVRYLQIKGLSKLAYETYDERHIPKRMRRPWSGNGAASGTWRDRPDHDKYYPDIAVPLELVPSFTIAAGTNQSIWVDVYIPKTAPAGTYLGRLTVLESGSLVGSIPVELQVYNFTLPDTPSSKTMLFFSSENINHRYLGSSYVNPTSSAGTKASQIRDRHFMLAHRHKLSLVGDDQGSDCAVPTDKPCPDWLARLDGSLFRSSNGYDGPGVGVTNNVYSVGTYGGWSWKNGTEADMDQHTDAWVNWFNQNAPAVDYFLYLIDESTNYSQIETWSQWILNNPGPGRAMRSMATISLTKAASQTPSLDIPTTNMGVGVTSTWQTLADQYTNNSRKQFFLYNGYRPAAGTTATEDDGVALRERAWAQYKKHIARWYFWETTYYNNFQGNTGQTNVFQTAQTFGGYSSNDPVLGQTGNNYSNGDGVLFYPGTDALFPSDSYGVAGPFASLRLKHWRRGIQDVDYLTLAANIDPATTQNIVNQMVPKALWEYGVDSMSDPSYVHTDISWSTDPQVWEAARTQLANIIATSPGNTGSLPAPTLNLPATLPVNAQISADYPTGYSIASFQWSILPANSSPGAFSRSLAALKHPAASNASTASATAHLADMNLAPGYYQISVFAIDSKNNASLPAQDLVTLVPVGSGAVQVYPNPWRANQAYGRHITFANLPDGASLKIFTVSGHLVKSPPVSGNRATWDLTNDSGDVVASGLYVYLAKVPDGQDVRGKIAIIK